MPIRELPESSRLAKASSQPQESSRLTGSSEGKLPDHMEEGFLAVLLSIG